jgi:hypothetical protein
MITAGDHPPGTAAACLLDGQRLALGAQFGQSARIPARRSARNGGPAVWRGGVRGRPRSRTVFVHGAFTDRARPRSASGARRPTVAPTTPMSGSFTPQPHRCDAGQAIARSPARASNFEIALEATPRARAAARHRCRRQPSSARWASRPCWRWIEIVRPSGGASSSVMPQRWQNPVGLGGQVGRAVASPVSSGRHLHLAQDRAEMLVRARR